MSEKSKPVSYEDVATQPSPTPARPPTPSASDPSSPPNTPPDTAAHERSLLARALDAIRQPFAPSAPNVEEEKALSSTLPAASSTSSTSTPPSSALSPASSPPPASSPSSSPSNPGPKTPPPSSPQGSEVWVAYASVRVEMHIEVRHRVLGVEEQKAHPTSRDLLRHLAALDENPNAVVCPTATISARGEPVLVCAEASVYDDETLRRLQGALRLDRLLGPTLTRPLEPSDIRLLDAQVEALRDSSKGMRIAVPSLTPTLPASSSVRMVLAEKKAPVPSSPTSSSSPPSSPSSSKPTS